MHQSGDEFLGTRSVTPSKESGGPKFFPRNWQENSVAFPSASLFGIPLTLELTMSDQKLTVPAHTVAVNVHGAMLLCSRTLEADTKLEIVNERTRERATARVTRASRENAEGYLIPIEFNTPLPAFWQISFPPSNWKPSDV